MTPEPSAEEIAKKLLFSMDLNTCVCDCLECKTNWCGSCELEKASKGKEKNHSLCCQNDLTVIVDFIQAERAKRATLEAALNPANLNVFDMMKAEEIKKEQVWPFILAAGHGCISGQVSEWPQIKPSFRWAQHHIESIESALKVAKEALEEIDKAEDGLKKYNSGILTRQDMRFKAKEALNQINSILGENE